MTKHVLRAGLAALSLSTLAVAAHATGSDPAAAAGLTALSELNLIVLGDMSGGDDVEGKTFVGGNLTNAATYGNGRGGAAVTSSSYPTLTVGGNASGNININNGDDESAPEGAIIGGNAGTVSINGTPASLTVGGSVGNFNANGDAYSHNVGPSVAAGIATQTAALTTDLDSLSTALAGLTPTGSVTNTDPNSFTLSATPNGAGYEVIDITAAELASAATIYYNFSSTTPTIINVSGASGYTFSANNNNGDAYSSTVLWNFEGATSVTFGTQEEGGVLAPYATVHNTSPIEGSVAVASFDQGGEVHLGTFLGADDASLVTAVNPAFTPVTPPPTPTAPVPEPATWWMMIGGAGLVGGVLRSRRKAAMAAA
jgi:choice-of-anchor A domain-containing protein